MILEAAVAAAAAAAVAYGLRQLRNRRAPPPEPGATAKSATALRPEARGLRVGDVLLYGDAELWLAGCIELREEGEFVARLFRAPGNERAEWVAQLDRDGEDLAILSATDAVPPGSVPAELPHGGILHQLQARGTVTLASEGEGVPSAPTASYVILGGTAGRLLFVLDGDDAKPRLELAGERLPRELLELLPGGD